MWSSAINDTEMSYFMSHQIPMTRENKFKLLFTYTRLFYVSAFSS